MQEDLQVTLARRADGCEGGEEGSTDGFVIIEAVGEIAGAEVGSGCMGSVTRGSVTAAAAAATPMVVWRRIRLSRARRRVGGRAGIIIFPPPPPPSQAR